MKRVLYPGSFDPPTYGHMNVVDQAVKLFDEVVIAVMKNESKKDSLFTLEERINMLKEIYKDVNNIKVTTGNNATVDIALDEECQAILRGLRGVTDFDYELQLATINRKLCNKQLSTLCLFPDNEFQHISSSVVKELTKLDKDISGYVHPLVKKKILKKKEEKCL